MPDYRLPSLGADMDKAILVEWLVQPGDAVKKGQIVALIETSKSVMDIEFFEDGVVEDLIVPVGESVAVGTPIAHYRPARDGAAAPAVEPEPAAEPEPEAPAAEPEPEPVPVAAATPAPQVSGGYRRIHPPARRLAEKLGVDLDTIVGTGAGGMVLRADVRAAAEGVAAAPSATPEEPPAEEPAEEPAGRPTEARAETATVPASPRARHLAVEHGIDLATITPTAPDGIISTGDVERAIAARAPATPEEPGVAAATAPAPAAAETAAAKTEADRARARRLAMRRAIADLMARSKREIPHYYLDLAIDMTRALTWLETENLSRPMAQRLLPAVLLIKAVARATHDVPEMNGFWVDDRFQPGEGVHTGVAISLREGGLIAPAIHDADRKSLDELMEALRDLVTRTRTGVLHRPEMTDPTITVTNLGDQGVDAVYGVIYPSQVALVGFGRVTEQPWAADGMVGARRVVKVTLAADHRASDGHRGGVFLKAIDRLLQEPEKL
ncbi:MAG: dihydrolipoamide acetyltransferase family protein [Chloroflexota bacterium]